MRPITADTVAQQVETDRLRQRLFVAEQLNDRLRRDCREYLEALAQLLKQSSEHRDADALIEMVEEFCEKDITNLCGSAWARPLLILWQEEFAAALDALRRPERGTRGPCKAEAEDRTEEV